MWVIFAPALTCIAAGLLCRRTWLRWPSLVAGIAILCVFAAQALLWSLLRNAGCSGSFSTGIICPGGASWLAILGYLRNAIVLALPVLVYASPILVLGAALRNYYNYRAGLEDSP